MASQMYNSGIVKLASGNILYLTDTIKAALLVHTFVPDKDTQHFFSDISASEVSGVGTNYTPGGNALLSKTVTEDDANDRAVIDAADPSWPGSTIPDAQYVAIYKDTGTPSTSPLLAIIDLGNQKSTNGDTFYVQLDAGGIFYIDQA